MINKVTKKQVFIAVIIVSLLIFGFTQFNKSQEKIEVNKVEATMIEMGNDIGFEYLRSDASPEVIKAQILVLLQNMKQLQDATEDKSEIIRRISISEIKNLFTVHKIHTLPKEKREEIAQIFMEKFSYENMENIKSRELIANEIYKILN